MTSLIEVKGREHSELQQKNVRECLTNYIKYEISGLRLTANTVSRYHSVVNIKDQGLEQPSGLW